MAIITNVTELQAMVDGVDYELANDIDASATSGWNWNAGRGVYEGFAPIAYYSDSFDGKGFKVTSLHIDRDALGVALFSVIDAATLQNVTLEDCNISTARGQVAALAYFVQSNSGPCVIRNCHSTGNVSAIDATQGRYAGGLLGRTYNNGGGRHTISECSSSVDAEVARGYAGGLAYHLEHCDVDDSFASGIVTSHNSCDLTGGFAGVIDDATIDDSFALGAVDANETSGWGGGGFAGTASDVIIRNCYARGAVTGYRGIGGFIGDMYVAAVGDVIENCYSTGLVTAHSYYGGFVGYDSGSGGTLDCFWDTQTSGQATSAGGTGKTTGEMKELATFSAWDIQANPTELNNGYPFLSWQLSGSSPIWYIYALVLAPINTDVYIVALEALRNIEMSAMGRVYTDEEGNLCYENRYSRQL